MTLIEEYLRAVAVLLPKAQREDIIAELHDTVLTRIEAREADLGRRLSDEEIEEVLRTVGHPITVAGAYGDGPRHAVGPTLYPYWAFAVKVAVTLQVATAVMVMLVRTLVGGNFGLAVGQAIGSAITGSLILIGIATGACWLVERRQVKVDYAHRWRVRDLRPLQFIAWDWSSLGEVLERRRGRPSGGRRSLRRAERWRRERVGAGVAGVVVGALALLWWTGLLPLTIVSGPDEARRLDIGLGPLSSVNWAALRDALWIPVAAWCVLVLGRGLVLIARPGASRVSGAFEIGQGLLALAIARWLWFDSAIGPLIRVDSVAAFFIRMREGLLREAPVDPAATLTLIVVIIFIAGLARTLQGLTLLILGGPAQLPPVSDDAPRGA